jgi:transcriptional regulator with XRE-family HTH domain
MEQANPLKLRRKGLGLSQAQLAAILKVDQTTISRAENAPIPDPRYELALQAIAAQQAAV